jgi:hypothetical protein
VDLWVDTDVSENRTLSIFSAEVNREGGDSMLVCWNLLVSQNGVKTAILILETACYIPTSPCGVTAQKTSICRINS